MFSSKRTKLFLALLFFAVCFSVSCRLWSGAGENTNADSENRFAAPEMPTGIPFPNNEPEVFQTEIVVTHFSGGEKFERKNFLARSGSKRLAVFGVGQKTEIALLETPEAKTFTILPHKKICKETIPNQSGGAARGDTLQDFLTTERLNAKTEAAFENLGAENGFNRFRARLGDSSDAAEILIYVDESLKIPVRQEFYRRGDDQQQQPGGAQRILLYSVELKNFQTRADEKLFQPPPDCRRVSAAEFDKIVWQTKE